MAGRYRPDYSANSLRAAMMWNKMPGIPLLQNVAWWRELNVTLRSQNGVEWTTEWRLQATICPCGMVERIERHLKILEWHGIDD